MVDSVLGPHSPEIGDQVAPSTTKAGIRCNRLEVPEVWIVAHHEDIIWMHATALDRDSTVGLIGRDDNVCRTHRASLDGEQEPAYQAGPTEPRTEEFRREVVVIEDETRSLGPRVSSGQQKEIRGIGGMDDIEGRSRWTRRTKRRSRQDAWAYSRT